MKFIFFALASSASALMLNSDIKIKQDCQYEDLNGNDHCVLKQGSSIEGPDACNPIPWDAVFNAQCNGWSFVQTPQQRIQWVAQQPLKPTHCGYMIDETSEKGSCKLKPDQVTEGHKDEVCILKPADEAFKADCTW